MSETYSFALLLSRLIGNALCHRERRNPVLMSCESRRGVTCRTTNARKLNAIPEKDKEGSCASRTERDYVIEYRAQSMEEHGTHHCPASIPLYDTRLIQGSYRAHTANHGNNRRAIHADRANASIRPLCGYVGGIGSRALNPNLHLSTLKRFSNRMYRIPARTGTLCAQKRDRDCAHFSVNTPRNSPSFSLASFRSSCFETSRSFDRNRPRYERKQPLEISAVESDCTTKRSTADNTYCYRIYDIYIEPKFFLRLFELFE